MTVTDDGLDDWAKWMAVKRAGSLYTRWRRLWDEAKLKHVKDDNMASMQKEWKLEIRTNFADADKNAAFKKVLQGVAKHLDANAKLLADGVKPRMIISSDDFFHTQEEIGLFEDTITQGKEALNDLSEGSGEADEISQELLDAVRNMKR